MNKKIIGIIVIMLLIASALTAVGTIDEYKHLEKQQGMSPINTKHETTVTLYPIADATVSEGYPDTNYGNQTYLMIMSSNEDWINIRSYLKFDLSGIPDDAIVTGAYLRLNCFYGGVAPVGSELYGFDGTWDENTLTWDNQPCDPEESDPLVSRNMTYDDIGEWCEWYNTPDIIDYIQECIEEDTVNLMLKSYPEYEAGFVSFWSRDHTEKIPELVVDYEYTTDCKLLIIASDSFVDEMVPLKQHKDATNIPTILLGLTQVYQSFPNPHWDVAEQVKRCIAHYNQSQGIEYVMLVGDIDKIPSRFIWWGLPPVQEGWATTDHYYADLYKDGTKIFDDWDSNNNNLYGEIEFDPDGFINNDNIDYLPDVSVGRIPASVESDVTIYVNKVIAYESLTTPTKNWFKNASFQTGDCDGPEVSNDIKDDIGNLLTPMGFKLKKRYYDWINQQPPTGMPGASTKDLNDGIGFFNIIAHGSPDGWGCNVPETTYLLYSSLKDLTNPQKLPIIICMACDVGRFAPVIPVTPFVDVDMVPHRGTGLGEEFDKGSYPHPNYPRPHPLQFGGITWNGTFHYYDLFCIAETFIFGHPNADPGTGAIAFLGPRTMGTDFGSDLDKFFFEAYAQGEYVLGDIWKNMMEKYYNHYDIKNSNTWYTSDSGIGHKFQEPQKCILFGDPSLRVGGCNVPPIPPKIDGPKEGRVGENLQWTFSSDDPNDNKVRYNINWGDATSEETDYYPDYTPVEKSHSYEKQGTYTITATTEDEGGLVSNESTFSVKVTTPRSKTKNSLLLLQWFERFPNLFPLLRYLMRFQ